jgi:hypothetical protein
MEWFGMPYCGLGGSMGAEGRVKRELEERAGGRNPSRLHHQGRKSHGNDN